MRPAKIFSRASVSRASALETTFQRIRQRYAIYYHLPEGVAAAEASALELDLIDAVRIRYPHAELRYRQVYLAGTNRRTFVKRVPPRVPANPGRALDAKLAAPDATLDDSVPKRRRAVNEHGGPRVAVTPVEKLPESAAASAPAGAANESSPEAPAPSKRRRAVSEPRGPRVVGVPQDPTKEPR